MPSSKPKNTKKQRGGFNLRLNPSDSIDMKIDHIVSTINSLTTVALPQIGRNKSKLDLIYNLLYQQSVIQNQVLKQLREMMEKDPKIISR
jgi:hypothetical protein